MRTDSIPSPIVDDLVQQLSKVSEDGWVTIDYVARLLREYKPSTLLAHRVNANSPTDELGKKIGRIVGWTAIAREVGSTANAMAVRASQGNLPIMPEYFGRSPTYTPDEIEQLKEALSQGRRRSSS